MQILHFDTWTEDSRDPEMIRRDGLRETNAEAWLPDVSEQFTYVVNLFSGRIDDY